MPSGTGSRSRRDFLRLVAGGGAALALARLVRGADAAPAAERPNFIIVFTDDQGYQDVGCFGSPLIRTPRLDRMAAEGMKFTDFYVAGPVCTPSRAALLTGCYPKRIGVTRVLFPKEKGGLKPEHVTVAEVLKSRGYATMCIGKWHVGDQPESMPLRQGFDTFFGLPYSNDMKPELLIRGDEVIENPAVQETLTERYTEEAVRFITENKDRPFFLYLPHTMPHIPLSASERFKGKSPRGLYGDVIEAIDWSTGEILDTLARLGIDERTLVVFTSDNGPWLEKGKDGGCALPLRSGKGTTWEGGMREPCIVRWPGHVPVGAVCREMALSMDLMPTFARLAGAELPAGAAVDGRDVWPLMAAAPGAKTPHEAFFYWNDSNLQAVRSGRWKVVLHAQGPAKEDEEPSLPDELYDLKYDIGETMNLALYYPHVVEPLRALAAKHCKELKGSLGKPRKKLPKKKEAPAKAPAKTPAPAKAPAAGPSKAPAAKT